MNKFKNLLRNKKERLSLKRLLTTTIGKDIVWTLLGQITIMMCLLILNKVLSNVLTIEDFGQYNIIRKSSSVLSFVLLGGMGIALPRYLAISISQKKTKTTKSILIGSVLYLIFVDVLVLIGYLLLKPILCSIVTGSDRYSLYILIYVYSLTTSLTSYLYAYYRGISKFKEFNISQIVIQLSIMVTLIIPADGIVDYIFYWTVCHFLCLIFYATKEYRKNKKLFAIKINRKEIEEYTKKMSIYSLPRMVGDFFLFAYSAFPLIYIGQKLSLTDVSFFSVGLTIFNLSNTVFSFLGIILLPLVSKMVAAQQINEADKLINKILWIYILIAASILMMLLLFMPNVINLFFSDSYIGASYLSKIICFSILPSVLYYLYRNPNDAISVFPFNTIILAISFALLVLGFYFCHSLESYAIVYLFVSIFQGLSSFAIWKILVKMKK